MERERLERTKRSHSRSHSDPCKWRVEREEEMVSKKNGDRETIRGRERQEGRETVYKRSGGINEKSKKAKR